MAGVGILARIGVAGMMGFLTGGFMVRVCGVARDVSFSNRVKYSGGSLVHYVSGKGLARFNQAIRARLGALCGLWLLLAPMAQAAPQGEIALGQFQLLYSALNSTLLPPEMATAYNLKRKADEVLVNITVLDTQTKRAMPVGLKGVAKNLIQQSKPLTFREIKEADAIYYLATLRTTEREVFHFWLDVTLPDGRLEKVKFTQELFVNP